MLRFQSESEARQHSVLVITPAGTALGLATAAIVYAAVDSTVSAASTASRWAGEAAGSVAGAAVTYLYGPASGAVTTVALHAGADTASSALRVAGRWGAAAAAALTGAVTALTVTAVEHGARAVISRLPVTGQTVLALTDVDRTAHRCASDEAAPPITHSLVRHVPPAITLRMEDVENDTIHVIETRPAVSNPTIESAGATGASASRW